MQRSGDSAQTCIRKGFILNGEKEAPRRFKKSGLSLKLNSFKMIYEGAAKGED